MSIYFNWPRRTATMAWIGTFVVLARSCLALASPPSHDPRPDRGPLLPQAHRIPYVSDQWTATHCFWLSGDRLLVFDPEWAEVLTPCDLDLRTGAERPLDALNRKIKAEGYGFGGAGSGPLSSARLSPDRQWIIWFEVEGRGVRSVLSRETLPPLHRAMWWTVRLDATKAVSGYSEDTANDVL